MRAQHLSRQFEWRSAVWAFVSLSLLAGWFFVLRPSVLGGPVTYSIVSGHSMEPTYEPGDYVIARTEDHYAEGDIVVFEVPGGVIVHRIVGGSAEQGFVTQGDNNLGIDPWRPSGESILGETWVHIPKLGILIGVVRGPIGIGVMVWLLTALGVLKLTSPQGRHRASSDPGAYERSPIPGAAQRGKKPSRLGPALTRDVSGEVLAYLSARPGRL